MKRKIIAVVVAGLAVLSLSACDADSTQNLVSRTVKLPDGRSVICVGNSFASGSGISCDWGNAK
jgi:hypothetical protein